MRPSEQMLSHERILAAIRGEEVDRFPVWLKMANETWRAGQPDDVRRLDDRMLLQAAGCDLILPNPIPVQAGSGRVVRTTRQEDGRRRDTWETPDGVLVGGEGFDPVTRSWHPLQYPVTTTEDLRALRWLFAETTYEVVMAEAESHWRRQQEMVAQAAVTMAAVGPGPLMAMVQQWAGPENAIFLHADYPELFAEVLEVMHQDRLRWLSAALPHCRAHTFWLSENASTTLISPAMFRDHCMEHLRAYAQLIADHDIIPVYHMCGTLNALLEMIDALPAKANEAYTTRPVGDVSLAEGRARMPSKALIGGTNAALWLEPADTIVETVARDVAECLDRRKIILTSAGVLPPAVSLDKARDVVTRLKRL